MDLHLLKLLTAEVLVLITIVHLKALEVMAVPVMGELHPLCLVVEDTVVVKGRGATEVVIEAAITAILEVLPADMEALPADMGEVPGAAVAMAAAETILMVTKEAAVAMEAAVVVATTMEAAEVLEEAAVAAVEEVSVEATEMEAAAAAEEDSVEALEAAMEAPVEVHMEPAEIKSSPITKFTSPDCQPI